MYDSLSSINYYQVCLKNCNEELMSSSIFYDNNSLDKFLKKLNLITKDYEIKHIKVNPKIKDLSYKFDKNYITHYNRYRFYNEDSEINTNPELVINTNPESILNSNFWINPNFDNSQYHYSNTLHSNLEGMILYNYSDGYMLKPDYYDYRYDKDAFHFGKWNDEEDAWYINSSKLDYVLECGAKLKVDDCFNYDNTLNEYLFCNMEFEDFDNGYILSFVKDKEDLVKGNYNIYEFSLYEDLWYEQGQGWLFTKGDKDFLEYNGAIYKDNINYVFDNMKFSESGNKGFKLIPEKDNKFYGLDNFLGIGKWRKTYWFFKKDKLNNMDFFINKGGVYIKESF